MKHLFAIFALLSALPFVTGATWMQVLGGSTPIQDNFNRANAGNLGANWTQDGNSVTIVSNQANLSGSGVFGVCWFSGVGWNPDHASRITVTTALSASKIAEAGVRLSSGAGYFASCDGSTYRIYRGDTDATIFSGSTTVNNGDTIELSVKGTALTFKVNGSVIATGSDSTFTTGAPGFALYADSGATVTVDNWVSVNGT